jgi:hypothetical protein
MSLREKRFGVALLASALALAATTDAQARFGGGGGGGGGHFGGGGGFGGGGMRMGGFGGGAMRMGGFGGGAMRMGSFGGGAMRMGSFGGMRVGSGAFHAGGRGLGAQSFHAGGLHSGLGAHNLAGGVGHTAAAQSFGHTGRIAAAHFAGHNFGHYGFHGPFPHPYPGFRGWYGYGWYGPVFWPFAYDVLFADLFWGYAYGWPFWAYGYPDIYGGLFWPYGYDDLAGYLPPGPGAVDGAYAVASVPQTRAARAAVSRQAEVTGQINQSCGAESKDVAGWPVDRIEQAAAPTADQRALLDDFGNASVRAAQAIKEACPTTVSFMPTGRLDAMQKRVEGMVEAVGMVAPPLDKFYNSLSDEQKARLNAANDQTGKSRSLANCGAVGSATQWPGERIEKAVQPNEEQQAKLDALKTAMANAADRLAQACPSGLPATPPARLSAISMRLDAMLASIKSVRGALDDFYGSLSDEQKAQFNLIGRQQSAQRQS